MDERSLFLTNTNWTKPGKRNCGVLSFPCLSCHLFFMLPCADFRQHVNRCRWILKKKLNEITVLTWKIHASVLTHLLILCISVFIINILIGIIMLNIYWHARGIQAKRNKRSLCCLEHFKHIIWKGRNCAMPDENWADRIFAHLLIKMNSASNPWKLQCRTHCQHLI